MPSPTDPGATISYPVFRRLRVFALNPGVATRLDSVLGNVTTVSVPWEDLEPGPVGEYVEVIDYDPPSRCFYPPVDLNHPLLLTQDGLMPSEASPQFHQQMAYAVALQTIGTFESALGRPALWAPARRAGAESEGSFVRRLRIYPHALREANAYYNPEKLALLFGYFPAAADLTGASLPGGMIFTGLSIDALAGLTVHALVDGARRHFGHVTGPDSRAFLVALADIVALFQTLGQADLVRWAMQQGTGDLSGAAALGLFAQQARSSFAASGVRDAIGKFDPATGAWVQRLPNPTDYETVLEPYDRAGVLVAAVFDAFLTIYKRRVANLLQIATGGTGVLPSGPAPALVQRLAAEAARTAHTSSGCVSAPLTIARRST